MNATILTPKASPPRPTARRWADVRLIPRIETFPQVVSFAQTAPGKVVLLAAFGLELRFFAPYLDCPTACTASRTDNLLARVPPIRAGAGASLPCAGTRGPAAVRRIEVGRRGDRDIALLDCQALAEIMVWPKTDCLSSFRIQSANPPGLCRYSTYVVVQDHLDFNRSHGGLRLVYWLRIDGPQRETTRRYFPGAGKFSPAMGVDYHTLPERCRISSSY